MTKFIRTFALWLMMILIVRLSFSAGEYTASQHATIVIDTLKANYTEIKYADVYHYLKYAKTKKDTAMVLSVLHASEHVPPSLLYSIQYVESTFRDSVVSHAGAIGRCQIMPNTAKYHGYSAADLYDPVKNVECAVKVLEDYYRIYGRKYLRAYNAGGKHIDCKEAYNYERKVKYYWSKKTL